MQLAACTSQDRPHRVRLEPCCDFAACSLQLAPRRIGPIDQQGVKSSFAACSWQLAITPMRGSIHSFPLHYTDLIFHCCVFTSKGLSWSYLWVVGAESADTPRGLDPVCLSGSLTSVCLSPPRARSTHTRVSHRARLLRHQFQ